MNPFPNLFDKRPAQLYISTALGHGLLARRLLVLLLFSSHACLDPPYLETEALDVA